VCGCRNAGGIKPQYDCIKAFSERDFSNDLREIDIPCCDTSSATPTRLCRSMISARKSANYCKNGTAEGYSRRPLTGMCTHACRPDQQ